MSKPKDLPIWLTVKVGTHKTANELLAAVEAKGMKVHPDILTKIGLGPLAATEERLSLVLFSREDIGIHTGGSRRNIYKQARSLGLRPCPAEVGPQLLLQYPSLVPDGRTAIASRPIRAPGGDLYLVCIVRDPDHFGLGFHGGHANGYWDQDDVFIFLVPEKK